MKANEFLKIAVIFLIAFLVMRSYGFMKIQESSPPRELQRPSHRRRNSASDTAAASKTWRRILVVVGNDFNAKDGTEIGFSPRISSSTSPMDVFDDALKSLVSENKEWALALVSPYTDRDGREFDSSSFRRVWRSVPAGRGVFVLVNDSTCLEGEWKRWTDTSGKRDVRAVFVDHKTAAQISSDVTTARSNVDTLEAFLNRLVQKSSVRVWNRCASDVWK